MDLFRAQTVPYMSRLAYVAECRHMLLWSVVVGLAEGNVAAVVVAKTFGGGEWLIAIAAAAPMFAKFVSLIWGMVCVGRRKLKVMGTLAALTTLTLVSITFTPQSETGGWIFVAQMALAQVFLAGVTTVRSGVWKANYPRKFRGQITARLQLLRAVVSIASMLTVAFLFDREVSAYRYVYPGLALFGVPAIFFLGKMRVRGEHSELHQNGASGDQLETMVVEPFSLAVLLSPGHVLGEMRRVLREDHRFARYCKALMMVGCGNVLIIPVMASIITRDLDLNYALCIVMLDVIPRGVMMGALFVWAPYFDRVGVVRFRVMNSLCWLAYILLGAAGTLLMLNASAWGPHATSLALGFYVMSRVFMGMSFGGGALAWNLGHLHFAKPHEAEVYMGIHVTLTGLRGLTMPFIGIWLWMHAGIAVWILASILSLWGLIIYIRMARGETAAL